MIHLPIWIGLPLLVVALIWLTKLDSYVRNRILGKK